MSTTVPSRSRTRGAAAVLGGALRLRYTTAVQAVEVEGAQGKNYSSNRRCTDHVDTQQTKWCVAQQLKITNVS